RGEDAEAVIAKRLENAREEVAQAPRFDFVVINAAFDDAVADLQAVVHAQRLKYASQRRSKAAVFQALHLD
ncbi:MAG TPA: guanylate kinase, partial [Methylibium sp.]|nr:guanylate kinase [Methylibium sp.]